MGGRGLCPVSHRNQTGPLVWSGYDANTAPLDTASIETKKSDATSVRRTSRIVVELGGIEPPTPRLPEAKKGQK